MVHAALLLLMLEAANARPRFTISLKRSTQNLQLSSRTKMPRRLRRSRSRMVLREDFGQGGAAERTFQLLHQVVGCRGFLPSRVQRVA